MLLFKTYFKILKKYWTSSLIYLIIFGGIFAVLILSSENTEDMGFKQSSYDIYIENNDDSELSTLIYGYLSDIHNVSSETYLDEELEEMLYFADIVYILRIPEGFGESFLNDGNVRLHNLQDESKMYGSYIDSQIESYLSSVKSYMAAGYDLKASDTLARKGLDTERIISELDKGDGKGFIYYIYLYLPYVLFSMIFCGTLPIMLSFRKKEIRDRMNASGYPAVKRSIGIIFGNSAASFLAWLLLSIIALIFVSEDLFTEIGGLLILNSLIFLLVCISATSFAGSFNLKLDGVQMISNVVSLSMCFLGGVFVPMELLSDGVKSVGRFLPTFWYVSAVNEVFNGKDYSLITKYMGIEITFAVFFIIITFVYSKFSSEKRKV